MVEQNNINTQTLASDQAVVLWCTSILAQDISGCLVGSEEEARACLERSWISADACPRSD